MRPVRRPRRLGWARQAVSRRTARRTPARGEQALDIRNNSLRCRENSLTAWASCPQAMSVTEGSTPQRELQFGAGLMTGADHGAGTTETSSPRQPSAVRLSTRSFTTTVMPRTTNATLRPPRPRPVTACPSIRRRAQAVSRPLVGSHPHRTRLMAVSRLPRLLAPTCGMTMSRDRSRNSSSNSWTTRSP